MQSKDNGNHSARLLTFLGRGRSIGASSSGSKHRDASDADEISVRLANFLGHSGLSIAGDELYMYRRMYTYVRARKARIARESRMLRNDLDVPRP